MFGLLVLLSVVLPRVCAVVLLLILICLVALT